MGFVNQKISIDVCKKYQIEDNYNQDMLNDVYSIPNIDNQQDKKYYCANLCIKGINCKSFLVKEEKLCWLFKSQQGVETTLKHGVCNNNCEKNGAIDSLIWLTSEDIKENKYCYLWSFNKTEPEYIRYKDSKIPFANKLTGGDSCKDTPGWTNDISGIGENDDGLTCLDYKNLGICDNGIQDIKYTGINYNFPEYNCVECGKCEIEDKCNINKLKEDCKNRGDCNSLETFAKN